MKLLIFVGLLMKCDSITYPTLDVDAFRLDATEAESVYNGGNSGLIDVFFNNPITFAPLTNISYNSLLLPIAILMGEGLLAEGVYVDHGLVTPDVYPFNDDVFSITAVPTRYEIGQSGKIYSTLMLSTLTRKRICTGLLQTADEHEDGYITNPRGTRIIDRSTFQQDYTATSRITATSATLYVASDFTDQILWTAENVNKVSEYSWDCMSREYQYNSMTYDNAMARLDVGTAEILKTSIYNPDLCLDLEDTIEECLYSYILTLQ